MQVPSGADAPVESSASPSAEARPAPRPPAPPLPLVDLDRPPPPYLLCVAHYRDRIRDGRLGDGDRLPSTR